MAETPSLRDKWPSILATVIIAPASAWLLSFAGAGGTIAGIAVGSALSGTGGALVERWIRQSHQAAARRLAAHRAAAHHGRPAPAQGDDPWERYYRPAAAARRLDIPWRRAALWGLAALVLSGGSIGVAEAAAHRSAASIVTGHRAPETHASVEPSVSPVPSYSPSPSVTVSPSLTPSPSPTVAPGIPEPSSSPSASSTPSPSPAASPSSIAPG